MFSLLLLLFILLMSLFRVGGLQTHFVGAHIYDFILLASISPVMINSQ